jgi:hypothetical protein
MVPVLVVLGMLNGASLEAQGTAFTYQGRLADTGSPANGVYDFQFTIFDALSGGNLVAGPITNRSVTVTDGLFTVNLDFGTLAFPGAARWMGIGVKEAPRASRC